MSKAPISGYQMGRAIGLTITPKDYTGVLTNLTSQAKARKAKGDLERAKQKREGTEKVYDRLYKMSDKDVDYTVQPIMTQMTGNLRREIKDRINQGYTDPIDFEDVFTKFHGDASYIRQVGESNKRSREAGQTVVNPFYDMSINTAGRLADLTMETQTPEVWSEVFPNSYDARTGIFMANQNIPRKSVGGQFMTVKPTDDEVIAAAAQDKTLTGVSRMGKSPGFYAQTKIVYSPSKDLAINKMEQSMRVEGGIENAVQDLIDYYGSRTDFEQAYRQFEIGLSEEKDQYGNPVSARTQKTPAEVISAMRISMADQTGELNNWISANMKTEGLSPIRATGGGGGSKDAVSNKTWQYAQNFTPAQINKIRQSDKKYAAMSNQQLVSEYNENEESRKAINSAAGAPGEYLTLPTGLTPTESITLSVKGRNPQAYSISTVYYDPGSKKYIAEGIQSMTVAGTGFSVPGQSSSTIGTETFELSKKDAADFYTQYTKTKVGAERITEFEKEAEIKGYPSLKTYAGIGQSNSSTQSGATSLSPSGSPTMKKITKEEFLKLGNGERQYKNGAYYQIIK